MIHFLDSTAMPMRWRQRRRATETGTGRVWRPLDGGDSASLPFFPLLRFTSPPTFSSQALLLPPSTMLHTLHHLPSLFLPFSATTLPLSSLFRPPGRATLAAFLPFALTLPRSKQSAYGNAFKSLLHPSTLLRSSSNAQGLPCSRLLVAGG